MRTTAEVPTVEEIPAACPHCGSTQRGKKEGVHASLEQGGIDSKGVPYRCIKWYYTTCGRCSGRYCVRRFER